MFHPPCPADTRLRAIRTLDVNYINQNLVEDKVVSTAKEYYLSSGRNYTGLEYEIEVVVLFMG
ncbi:hypothetical protein H4K35_15135 [Myroides sp. NP-2]|uniref:hypothetical protein n=1 Tax=Myroides sp. NP-2 TaxID=2759945 RepID=UPI0015F8AEAE|nr:hypothetical protein [Myroides sp. NP-2]MBB1151419.1 hypothetical protein [Myroides sp. NP-2]